MPLWFVLALLASAPPPVPAASTEPPGFPRLRHDTVTIAVVGHLVPATDWPKAGRYLPPGDGSELVAPVAGAVREADLAFGNLAAPIATVGRPKDGHDLVENFAFRTPPVYAAVLTALGIDAVQAANNHTLDFGPEADAESLANLDRLQIAHVGRVGEVYEKTVNGIRVAFIGFTQPYVPAFQSNRDIPAAGKLVKALKANHELVVVMIHGGAEGLEAGHVPRGAEYLGAEFRGRLYQLSHHLVDQGADLVAVVGPHQPRAIEMYRGRVIDYGLGCFFGYGPFELRQANGYSLVLQVELDREGQLVHGHVAAFRMDYPGIPARDIYGWGLALIRRLSRTDFPESAPDFGPTGDIAARGQPAKAAGK